MYNTRYPVNPISGWFDVNSLPTDPDGWKDQHDCSDDDGQGRDLRKPSELDCLPNVYRKEEANEARDCKNRRLHKVFLVMSTLAVAVKQWPKT
jgi:hypothetical protein